MNTMKLTLEMENKKVLVEIPEDSDAYEVVDAFKVLMLAMTFHPDTIESMFVEAE